MAGGKAVAVVVFANRVATARRTYRLLVQKYGERAILLTGRMRPLDKDDTVKERLEMLSADVSGSRQLDAPMFVVATQTLEVGANLDFDMLVTECASLDALRQRFGRLNRMGRGLKLRRPFSSGPTRQKTVMTTPFMAAPWRIPGNGSKNELTKKATSTWVYPLLRGCCLKVKNWPSSMLPQITRRSCCRRKLTAGFRLRRSLCQHQIYPYSCTALAGLRLTFKSAGAPTSTWTCRRIVPWKSCLFALLEWANTCPCQSGFPSLVAGEEPPVGALADVEGAAEDKEDAPEQPGRTSTARYSMAWPGRRSDLRRP